MASQSTERHTRGALDPSFPINVQQTELDGDDADEYFRATTVRAAQERPDRWPHVIGRPAPAPQTQQHGTHRAIQPLDRLRWRNRIVLKRWTELAIHDLGEESSVDDALHLLDYAITKKRGHGDAHTNPMFQWIKNYESAFRKPISGFHGDGGFSALENALRLSEELDFVASKSLLAPARRVITLIGRTGAGKSTLANLLVGMGESSDRFAANAGIDSVTHQVSQMVAIPDSDDFAVVDTPGLGDTAHQSTEYFQAITQHLNTHGGVVCFVREKSALTDRDRRHFEALARATGDAKFSTFCVLISTKARQMKKQAAAQAFQKYQQDLQSTLHDTIHGDFAGLYGWEYEMPSSFRETLLNDLKEIPGIVPGRVQEWNEIVAVANRLITNLVFIQRKLPESSIQQDALTPMLQEMVREEKQLQAQGVIQGIQGSTANGHRSLSRQDSIAESTRLLGDTTSLLRALGLLTGEEEHESQLRASRVSTTFLTSRMDQAQRIVSLVH